MADYKTAKEAFVSDNLGSSVWSINKVSLAAMSCYCLYASLNSSKRRGPIIDYITTVWPLLLSVTVASNHPYLLNAAILAPVIYSYFTRIQRSGSSGANGHATSPKTPTKGQWLEESDSDEEPVQPTSASRLRVSPRIQLPSETVPTVDLRRLSPSPSPSPVTPTTDTLSPDNGTPDSTKWTWRRRHSPTPSTHTHMAIDILPTPETSNSAAMAQVRASYPARSARPARIGVRPPSDRLPFLSVYRAHMMVMTVHCILAVDFQVFPRYLGKCEDFGTSLMDVGVGSFVFSLGIVSSRSLLADAASRGLFLAIVNCVKKSLPVLLLGLVRVLMVKGTEYPEHVTEYGVHWNFFFTLGCLPILGTILTPLRTKLLRWSVLGILVTICHQIILTTTSLQSYTLSPLRSGLLGMNKEGLVSLSGYLAIYLLGLSIGEHISRCSSPSKIKSGVSESEEEHAERHYRKRRVELALELFGYALGFWVVLVGCRLAGVPVSRRFANLPYVLWTCAYNVSSILIYLLIEMTFFNRETSWRACPPLLEAININGLVIFLIANLLTGLVNLSVQTMYAGRGMSMLVLHFYSLGVCSIAWLLKKKRLKL